MNRRKLGVGLIVVLWLVSAPAWLSAISGLEAQSDCDAGVIQGCQYAQNVAWWTLQGYGGENSTLSLAVYTFGLVAGLATAVSIVYVSSLFGVALRSK